MNYPTIAEKVIRIHIYLCILFYCNGLIAQNLVTDLEWEVSYSTSEAPPEENWSHYEEASILPPNATVWFRTQFINTTEDSINRILLLSSAQRVEIFINGRDSLYNSPMVAGTTVPLSELRIPNGLIINGIGNSGQEWVKFPPGTSELLLKYEAAIYEHVSADFQLLTEEEWHKKSIEQRSNTYLFQGLLLGALLIISIYHLLIFMIRRDFPFLWYAVYTIVVAIVLALEGGLLQTLLFQDSQFAFRLLWETQFLSMICAILYFVFMRSFLDLDQLMPWLDKLVIRFLLMYAPFGILADVHYIVTLQFTPWSFIFPLAVLLLGLFCVFQLMRSGNTLAKYFAIGSLVLFMGAFSNTILSILVNLHWMTEPSFPRIWITEAGILIEILIFSLGLGYRLRLQDQERELAVTRLRTKISSDLHDDVGSMLTGLSMQSKVMSYTADGPIKENLKQISEISRRALETMRDTVWAIDARRDNYASLIDKMRDFAEINVPQDRFTYQLKTSGLNANELIPPDIRQQTYLIYKEALTNAIKYCNGDTIDLQLSRSTSLLKLTIADNGTAIPSGQSSGQGIRNMRMRAEQLGGSFFIDFKEGCRIVCEIPL